MQTLEVLCMTHESTVTTRQYAIINGNKRASRMWVSTQTHSPTQGL